MTVSAFAKPKSLSFPTPLLTCKESLTMTSHAEFVYNCFFLFVLVCYNKYVIQLIMLFYRYEKLQKGLITEAA
jgi:hypothetical protein